MSWTRIWNEDGAVLDRTARSQELSAATFLLETRHGASAAARDVLWCGDGDTAMSLHVAEDGAVDLRHRAMQLRSEPGVVQTGEAFRLVYRSGDDGQASLEVRSLDRPGVACFSRGFTRPALLTSDFVPVEPVIHRFGGLAALANHNAPHADHSGLQAGTMVGTPAGPRPVDQLRPGDVVFTDRGEAAIVQGTERAEAVCLGSMNAVRLRAPYFGLTQDVFVARKTQVLLSGPDIDYMFGTERVTAQAGDLVNNTSVLRDLSEPVRDLVTVVLDRPGCISVGRLGIAGAEGAADCPSIDRIGAQSLLASAGDMRKLVN